VADKLLACQFFESKPAIYMNLAISYIGLLWEGGTCLDRKRALERLGFQVHGFDVTGYRGQSRILAGLEARLHFGPNVVRLNRDIIEFVKNNQKNGIIWFDKATWIWPETLQTIRRLTRATLLHYTPDPQLMFHRSRHFNACIPLFDAVITTKRFEVELYKQHGARNIILTWQSFARDRFFPKPPRRDYITDVTLIGHYEEHYAGIALAAQKTEAHVGVWGPGWLKARAKRDALKACVKGGGLWGDDYAVALSSARICLGVLSKWIPETHTTRSLEIPASGSLLLAERTEEHQELFREGYEAEFFSDWEELQDKIRYYLRNESLRLQVATRGRERCIRDGYDDVARLAQVMRQIPGNLDAMPG
jgi:spore maturation protein CgeB